MMSPLMPLGFKNFIPKADIIGIYDASEYMDDYMTIFGGQHPNTVIDVTNKRKRGCYVETVNGKIYLTSYPVDLTVAIYCDTISPEQQNEIEWIESDESLTKREYTPSVWGVIYGQEKRKFLNAARERYEQAKERDLTVEQVREDGWVREGLNVQEMRERKERRNSEEDKNDGGTIDI